MIGYTKIFGSMLDSTVWMLSKEARLLWITMLLKKDRDQVVRGSLPGLAHAARLTLEETLSAMEELQQPDEYSQSREEGGRRVIVVDAGWMVVNGAKYRDQMTADDRREYNKMKQREYRKRKKFVGLEGAKAGAQQAISDGLEGARNDDPECPL